jgi:hypothetical protein
LHPQKNTAGNTGGKWGGKKEVTINIIQDGMN